MVIFVSFRIVDWVFCYVLRLSKVWSAPGWAWPHSYRRNQRWNPILKLYVKTEWVGFDGKWVWPFCYEALSRECRLRSWTS